jgi:NSS family neurotransmitter:Na+ symporter
VLQRLPVLRDHANRTSAVPLHLWWMVVLAVVTPLVLGWMMVDSLRQELAENYEGYDTVFLLVSGWGVAAAAIVFGIVMSLLRWRAADQLPAVDVREEVH